MSILVIAPHADDETLGMGGSIAKFVNSGKEVSVAVITGPGPDPHPLWPEEFWHVVRREAADAIDILGVGNLLFENLPAACLADGPAHRVNEVVSKLISKVDPEELYLPYYHDLHHDHRSVTYAALVHARGYLERSFRLRLIAMYETPTETHLFPAALHPEFTPNMWIDISATIENKLAAWACYRSQHLVGSTPRSPEVVRAHAAVRGAEIGTAAAEAFVILRSRL